MTKPRSWSICTRPRLGCLVVKGYGAISGRARERRLRSVLLPALGRPTRPTSAISFSSSRTVRTSPGSPGVDCRGARLVAVLKRLLPLPPLPPRATTTCSPSLARSLSTLPCSASMITVPGGTAMTRSLADAPWQFAPVPCSPGAAFHAFLWASIARLSTPSRAKRTTLPPSPPSPPSGPPNGTYFSRRKLTQPSPPLPASKRTTTSSTNIETVFRSLPATCPNFALGVLQNGQHTLFHAALRAHIPRPLQLT